MSLWFNSASAAPSIERVDLGFDGHYKLGFWAPLTVELKDVTVSDKWSLEAIVPDSDGVPTRVREPISGSKAKLFVKIGRNRGDLTVVLRDGETEVARREFNLTGNELIAARPSDSWLLVSLGTTQHLANSLARSKALEAAGGRVATVTQAGQLPDRWFGYDGVDVVVLSAGAAELPQLLAAKSAMKALDDWVRRGGTLLISGGGRGETLLGAVGPVAAWAPGRFDRTISLTNPTALELASGVDAKLEPLADGKFSLPAVRLTAHHGMVRLNSIQPTGELPLIIERRHGFGRVLFFAIDLDEPLLDRWAGTAPLVTNLLLPQRPQSETAAPQGLGELTHAGYDDLAGQLRSALDQFQNQGVRVLPFGALMGLLLAYVALLGPGDYFLLKRGLKRMELTWITMPLLIVLSCGAAYALAVGLKGREIRLNQVDLVDYDEVQQARRASSYFNVFSPHGQAYDLSLRLPPALELPPLRTEGERIRDELARSKAAKELPGLRLVPATQDTGVLLSWFGLPGAALGGMESGTTAPLAGHPYDYAPRLDALREVPIPVWSTKSFVARWTPQDAPPFSAKLSRQRGDVEGLLRGQVTNGSPWVLTQCVLLSSRWAYPLGTLQPGQRLAIQDDLGPRALSSQLTRRPGLPDQYDRYSNDIDRIVELMSFYQEAGGIDYTRLKHRFEPTADLSAALSHGQAVLVGVHEGPAAEVRNSKQPLVTNPIGCRTIYRTIVPISDQ